MPTYSFECPDCGAPQEVTCPMSERPKDLPCECGATAERVYNWQGHGFVRGNERPMKLDATCVPLGWERGNIDPEKQQRRYDKLIREKKKLAKANKTKAIKGGLRQIASVPRELVRMRQNQYGRDYYSTSQPASELKEKLKSDGMLFDD